MLIARALCALSAGDELLVSYGDQPDLLFALHYGFVPAPEEGRLRAEVEAVRAELAEDAAGGRHADDHDHDHDDAVRAAARAQLEALERGEARARAIAGARPVRACCVSLAQALRESERRVLERLCSEAAGPGALA